MTESPLSIWSAQVSVLMTPEGTEAEQLKRIDTAWTLP